MKNLLFMQLSLIEIITLKKINNLWAMIKIII